MYSLIVLLIVLMVIVTIVQLIKVSELSSRLNNETHEEIPHKDNILNKNLFRVWAVVFLGGFTYFLVRYGITLPEAASEHGAQVDTLMNVNMIMIFIVFYAVHFALFHFSIKYTYDANRKAVFFAHSTKLELIWTIIPSVVLMGIILFGLITWFEMTDAPTGDFDTVEITSEQFNWTVRYPGKDDALGSANFNLIGTENRDGGTNSLGIVTPYAIDYKIKEIDAKITKLEHQITKELDYLAESNAEFIEDEIYRAKRQKQRILELREYDINGVEGWKAGEDDIMPNPKELHVVVDKYVQMIFKSKDVIHSAYLPHFRAQMNCVPGGPNTFKMKPTITTKQMRLTEGEDFDYLLLCNKICGASHYKMQIPVIVETQAEYDQWMAEQSTYVENPSSSENSNNANQLAEGNKIQ